MCVASDADAERTASLCWPGGMGDEQFDLAQHSGSPLMPPSERSEEDLKDLSPASRAKSSRAIGLATASSRGEAAH